jgi:hypothetical protein
MSGAETKQNGNSLRNCIKQRKTFPKNGITIDATASVARVVDEIVRQSEAAERTRVTN